MKTIIKMYQHLVWANQQILDAIRTIDEERNGQCIRLFSHILFAEQVWITRMKGSDSSHLPIWGEANLVECAALLARNQQLYNDFLSNLKEEELEKIITYKNSKGAEFQTNIRDILTHVAIHGQHHRGQINQRLRADGYQPAGIDYITFMR